MDVDVFECLCVRVRAVRICVSDSGTYLTVIQVCMCNLYNEAVAVAAASAYGLCIIVIDVRHF